MLTTQDNIRNVRKHKKYIDEAHWRDIAENSGMTKGMLAIGTRFLHETGQINFFGDFTIFLSPSKDRKTANRRSRGIVFLSPEFLLSVMQGLFRHERQSLSEYFASRADRLMLTRANRLNASGKMHHSLVPLLWPSSHESEDYWNKAMVNKDPEKD